MKASENVAAWKLLLALAKTDSLTQAAIQEDVELSAASRLLSSLERDYGVTLLNRRTRPMKLHESVRRVIPDIAEFLDRHEKLGESIRKAAGSSREPVRLSVPVNITRSVMLRTISRFTARVPEFRVELMSEADHVDVLNGRVDVASLPYRPVSPELSVTFIARGTTFMAATPEYLRKRGTPREPEDLRGHTLSLRSGRNYPVTRFLYSESESFELETGERRSLGKKDEDAGVKEAGKAKGGGASGRSFAPDIFYSDTLSCLQRVCSGGGIAVDITLGMLEPYLRAGTLVPVLTGWHRPLWEYTLATRKRNTYDTLLMEFIEWFAKCEREAGAKRNRHWFSYYGEDYAKVLKAGH